jgi:CRISPR/Cas system endoribonuclease Cas6 (RAMP superfamily)
MILALFSVICEEKVKKRCFKGEKRLIFSTVYKKFIKNLVKTLDKDPEKGYIISVG